MSLYEKHRPRRVQDLRGYPEMLPRLQRLLQAQGFAGGAFWIEGKSGQGKTTLARCIVNEFVTHDMDFQELDGANCLVETVRDLESWLSLSAWGSGWKAVVINEAHAMSPKAIQAWLTLLEKLKPHRLVLFTTTETKPDLFGNFNGPMMSRCKCYRLEPDLEDFARFVQEVAQKERLDPGYELGIYRDLLVQYNGNLRAVLQRIESGEWIPITGPAAIGAEIAAELTVTPPSTPTSLDSVFMAAWQALDPQRHPT